MPTFHLLSFCVEGWLLCHHTVASSYSLTNIKGVPLTPFFPFPAIPPSICISTASLPAQ